MPPRSHLSFLLRVLLKLSDGNLIKFIEDEKDVKDGESTAVDLERIRFLVFLMAVYLR